MFHVLGSQGSFAFVNADDLKLDTDDSSDDSSAAADAVQRLADMTNSGSTEEEHRLAELTVRGFNGNPPPNSPEKTSDELSFEERRALEADIDAAARSKNN